MAKQIRPELESLYVAISMILGARRNVNTTALFEIKKQIQPLLDAAGVNHWGTSTLLMRYIRWLDTQHNAQTQP